MPDYFILQDALDERFCAIWDYLDDFPDIENPSEGIPMGGAFPGGVRFQMSPEFGGLRIADVLNNALGYLMISGRMKQLLEQTVTAPVEYLRFTLLNHKGRVASTECYIANVLGSVDCVDVKRTQGLRSHIEPDRYTEISRLFLLPDRIPADRNLFRISSQPRTLIIREDLRTRLEAEEVTGVSFLELGTDVELE